MYYCKNIDGAQLFYTMVNPNGGALMYHYKIIDNTLMFYTLVNPDNIVFNGRSKKIQ